MNPVKRHLVAAIMRKHRDGMPTRTIAKRLGLSHAQVQAVIERHASPRGGDA